MSKIIGLIVSVFAFVQCKMTLKSCLTFSRLKQTFSSRCALKYDLVFESTKKHFSMRIIRLLTDIFTYATHAPAMHTPPPPPSPPHTSPYHTQTLPRTLPYHTCPLLPLLHTPLPCTQLCHTWARYPSCETTMYSLPPCTTVVVVNVRTVLYVAHSSLLRLLPCFVQRHEARSTFRQERSTQHQYSLQYTTVHLYLNANCLIQLCRCSEQIGFRLQRADFFESISLTAVSKS